VRLRQWSFSILLFAASLSFLLFSKYFFTAAPAPESQSSLPVATTAESQIILLANKDYYPFLKQRIRAAQKTITGTVYLFKAAPFRDNEPSDLLHELIMARKRKVDVNLVIDISSGDQEDKAANLYASELLRKGGVKVLLDSSTITTHAKTFVIDDRYCFVGSHNLTHAAMSQNEELSLFVDSPEMAKKIEEFIRQIPLTASPAITPETADHEKQGSR
jgi:phosphatidylserine/phosphatidylglycerophosphate/cardiolipin synthase-like enzyme